MANISENYFHLCDGVQLTYLPNRKNNRWSITFSKDGTHFQTQLNAQKLKEILYNIKRALTKAEDIKERGNWKEYREGLTEAVEQDLNEMLNP